MAKKSTGFMGGFRLTDLAGSVPPDHSPTRHTADGELSVRLNQIWVDRETDELWEVVRLPQSKIPQREGRFEIGLYGFWSYKQTLLLAELIASMEVLEEAIASRSLRLAELHEQYQSEDVDKLSFPNAESFIKSLGFDPVTGFRIN